MAVKKSKAEIATIDCNLITIEVDATEFGFQTANKIAVVFCFIIVLLVLNLELH